MFIGSRRYMLQQVFNLCTRVMRIGHIQHPAQTAGCAAAQFGINEIGPILIVFQIIQNTDYIFDAVCRNIIAVMNTASFGTG